MLGRCQVLFVGTLLNVAQMLMLALRKIQFGQVLWIFRDQRCGDGYEVHAVHVHEPLRCRCQQMLDVGAGSSP